MMYLFIHNLQFMQPAFSPSIPMWNPEFSGEAQKKINTTPKKSKGLIVRFQAFLVQSLSRQPNSFRSEALERKLMEEWKNGFASHDPDAIEKANNDF